MGSILKSVGSVVSEDGGGTPTYERTQWVRLIGLGARDDTWLILWVAGKDRPSRWAEWFSNHGEQVWLPVGKVLGRWNGGWLVTSDRSGRLSASVPQLLAERPLSTVPRRIPTPAKSIPWDTELPYLDRNPPRLPEQRDPWDY